MPKGVSSYESCLGIIHVGKTLEQEVRAQAMEPSVTVTSSGLRASELDLRNLLWHP